MTHAAPQPSARPDLLTLTTALVVAFVAHSQVEARAVPKIITATYAALSRAALQGSAAGPAQRGKPGPAAIRQSHSEDGIVSFLNGRTYRMLRRHLAAYGHTPQSYRQYFGLPVDYPMVAPAYSAARSAHAKASGLGVMRRRQAEAGPV